MEEISEIIKELFSTTENSVIRFKDRTEIRFRDNPHYLEGPAIEYNEGRKEYYIYGKKYSIEDFNIEATILKRKGKIEFLMDLDNEIDEVKK